MKQFFLSVLLIIGLFVLLKDDIVIPKDAIRLRIIASSNSEYDQQIKLKVKNKIETEMYNLLKDTKTSEESKNIIQQNLTNIDGIVKNVLNANSYGKIYNISFGMNYFPQKEYKGISYKEGMYESLVITLGNGEGENWWCVMFPPFCLVEAEEHTDVEYRWLIKDMINKY